MVLVVLMGVANSKTPVDADISVDTDTPPTPSREGRKILSVTMIGVLAICCGWIFRQQKGYYEGYKKWNTLKMLYNSKAYDCLLYTSEKTLANEILYTLIINILIILMF